MATYVIEQTTQLMENHLAAQPLGSQSALAAAKTADHDVMLFSVDATSSLRVTIGQEGHPTGWTTQVISSSITTDGAAIRTFGVAQAVDTDGQPATITLVAAVTVGSGTGSQDQLYAALLDVDVNATWMADPSSITWTARPFDYAGSLTALTASTLRVADIMLAMTSASEALCVVNVVDPDDGLDRPFAVELSPDVTTGVWTYMAPERDYTTLLDSAVGQPRAFSLPEPGIYKLYSIVSDQQNEVTLTFKPTALSARFFAVSANATALATVPFAGAGPTYTTLLVADGGSIVVYPYDSTGQDERGYFTGAVAVSSPAGSSILNDVTSLHAAADGSLLTVWGVNGSRQIFHVQAEIDDAGHLSNWSVPMPLLSGFVAASPYLSQTRQRSTIFAVVVGTDGNEQLIELASDPVDGGGWTRRQLQLPATNSFVTLKTYTTRVQVLDSGMTRAAATNVQVTASHSTIAQINGLHYTIGPNRPATVATDAGGSLTLVNAASGLGVPTYGFAIVDPLTTGVQAPSSIDPTAGVRAQLSTYRTGSQLLAAQTTTPTGTSQPLLSGVSAAGADQIASAIQAACSVVGAAPPPPPPPPSSSTGILADLGDIVQAVTDAFDDAVASIEQAAEGAWMLVVQIGETAFSAIISTAEDVVNCIVAVFNAVKTVFEDIFRWLAFLFNWQNILTIQRQLVSFYTALLQEAEQLVTKGLTVVASWIDYLGAQIEEGGASLLAGLPDQSTDALTAQTQSLQGQAPVARTDPRLYWGQDQVSSSFSAPSTSPAAVVIADETDPLAQAFEQLGTAIATVTAGWAGDVQSLINGAGLKTVAGELLEGFGSLVESFGSLLQAVAVDVGDQLTGLQSDLQTPLDIPLLSAIYSAITGGESLNVLSLACLLQAVPATLAYDIATDGNGDPANFLPAATVDQICTTLSAAADDLPQPPGSLQADAVGTRSGAAVTELLATPPRSRSAPHLIDDVDSGGVDPTLIILGLLHISRALSTEFVAGVKLGEGPAPPDSRKFFIADGVIWMFEGILDYANDQTAENAIIGTCNFCLVQSG